MANPNRGKGPASAPLHIVGASARAAAFSALGAGLAPSASDLFGDADLRRVGRFVELDGEYPGGLVESVRRMGPGPVLYTGGLENHPAVVDALGSGRALWGNPGAVLTKARNPVLVREALSSCGAHPPEVRLADDPPSERGGWLRKPLTGSGGSGIAPAAEQPTRETGVYYQRIVSGASYSSLHLAANGRGRLLGITRQLVGAEWLHAAPMAWCGNVGPIALAEDQTAVVERAGDAATRAFGLRGLFGIDFVIEGGRVCPIEINPRYTASTELLEHGLEFSAIALHAAVFDSTFPTAAAPSGPTAATSVLGKAVLFAPHDLVVFADLLSVAASGSNGLPAVADIPAAGTTIRQGKPVFTVFAQAATPEQCEAALRERTQEMSRHLRPATAEIGP